jgi:hypothetical protein
LRPNPEYLIPAMKAYVNGQRHHGLMRTEHHPVSIPEHEPQNDRETRHQDNIEGQDIKVERFELEKANPRFGSHLLP